MFFHVQFMAIILCGQTSVAVAKVAVMVHKLELEIVQILLQNMVEETVPYWAL